MEAKQKSNDELDQLISNIVKKRDVANRKAVENSATYRVQKGKIKRAQEDLKDLFLNYREIVQNRSAFIVTTGTQSDKFTKIAQEEFGCFAVGAEDFYNVITEKVHKRLYENQASSPNLFDNVSAALEDTALEVGIISLPAFLFESKYKKLLKNKEDMVSLIKKAFNEKIGAEVNGLYAIDRVAREGFEKDFSSKTIPIVIHTKDQELALELANGLNGLRKVSQNVFLVTAGTAAKETKTGALNNLKTTNEKSVEKTLVKIRENLS